MNGRWEVLDHRLVIAEWAILRQWDVKTEEKEIITIFK